MVMVLADVWFEISQKNPEDIECDERFTRLIVNNSRHSSGKPMGSPRFDNDGVFLFNDLTI